MLRLAAQAPCRSGPVTSTLGRMTQSPPLSAHSNKRFERAVERVGAEAFWLKTYHTAICGMKVHAIGLDFFRVSLNSLKDARLIRLIRVLEDDCQTASFWYLLKSDSRRVQRAAKKAKADLKHLADVSTRLRGIRDKTFVHIDKTAVFNPDRLYRTAGLTHDDLEKAIVDLWSTLRALYEDVFKKELAADDYSGTDIVWLASLRDAALDYPSK
jgi:hypothetical protein